MLQTLMFPPSLFEYVTQDLKKNMILVMNKVDLVESKVVLAWKKYFAEVYPEVSVVLFTSYPGYCLRNTSGMNEGKEIGIFSLYNRLLHWAKLC